MRPHALTLAMHQAGVLSYLQRPMIEWCPRAFVAVAPGMFLR